MPETKHYFVTLEDHHTVRHCWVNKFVRVGDHLTLKNSEEPKRWWEVTYVSDDVRTDQTLPGGGWHVGGL